MAKGMHRCDPPRSLKPCSGSLQPVKTTAEIASQTGIPRRTVWDWRREITKFDREVSQCIIKCAVLITTSAALPAPPYCYLLGLYLGDGCVSRHPRAWLPRGVLDAKYPDIIDRCREAINALMPGPVRGERAQLRRLRRGLAVRRSTGRAFCLNADPVRST